MILRDNAEHCRWGDGCEGWHLVRTPEMSLIEELMPPGTAEVAHRHGVSRQFFRVLSGELTVTCDGVPSVVGAAEGVEIAPGVVHEVRNAGTVAASFLVALMPPSHGDREVVAGRGVG